MSKEAEKYFNKISRSVKGDQTIFYKDKIGYTTIAEIMESYHKSQVESITDEMIKDICTKFFYHWWNTQGNNTDEGFDNWWKENKQQLLKLSK